MAGPTLAAADGVPQAVKNACRGDFIKHCITHTPGTPGARTCMAGAFERLSDPCVSAILSSDLVDEKSSPAQQTVTTAKTVKPPAKNTKARTATRTKKYKTKQRRKVARHKSRKPRQGKISRYINRGTKIANRYINKAFAKAFR
ncbi:MAG: hypothetical protein AAFV45_13530 [Pseudomonadota bacterium]